MRLLTQIMGRTFLALIIVMPIWGFLFYFAILEEVYDEIDDQLEDYGEMLIDQVQKDHTMPTYQSGSNNIYFFAPIAYSDLQKMRLPYFKVKDVYFPSKNEYEPARVYKTSFQLDGQGYYLLTIYTPIMETADVIESIFIWILVLFVSLTIILCLVNWMVYKGSTRPLFRLLKWFEQFKLGSHVAPLNNATNIKEFQELNKAVMLSVERNEALYEQQKQFIGNASHEIQTPIAVAKNRIELLLDTDLSEEQMGELLQVNRSLTYISRLNRSLLLLSKLDNGQVNVSEKVSVSQLVEDLIADLELAYASKRLVIQTQIAPNSQLYMDAALCQTLFGNLIKNAFVHSFVGAAIRIELSDNTFQISNGIFDKPLDEANLYKRFYQVHRVEGTSGLGLAIANAICKVYHLDLGYHFIEGFHTFKVSWTNK